MGNSTRWRKLIQWLDYLKKNGIEITTKELAEKVSEIKEGKQSN